MTRDDIHKAIADYLSLFEEKVHPLEEQSEKLTLALDYLALAYHFAECDFDEADYPDAPEPDYQQLRDAVASLFPGFGYYNIATDISINIGQTTLGVGDAIGDISEIAVDLLEVKWLWENTSVENALWEFKWGYENHWGDHLRNLQIYIKANSRGF